MKSAVGRGSHGFGRKDKRWVTVAFTWNGLRALGVDEGSLATFPEEFKQGMVARAEMLGDTGENHPDNWVGGLASRTFTPSPSCSPATPPSVVAARPSTTARCAVRRR